MEAVEFVNGLWLAHCRIPHRGTMLIKLTTVKFINRLGGKQQMNILFINELRLAMNHLICKSILLHYVCADPL